MKTRGDYPTLRSRGRGGSYSLLRGLVETGLRVLYRGGWAADLWGATPMARRVDLLRFELPLLRAGHAPLRIAFASDLHLGPTTAAVTLDAAFDHLRQCRADVVLLGGDFLFLDATPAIARELGDRLKSLEAPLLLAVMGNHDLWTENELVERALLDAGVELLINDSRRLDPPHDDVVVVGLDEPWTGAPDAKRAFRDADAAVRIVLCHSPDGLTELDGQRVDLFLCGHTHGGHVCLPGEVPIVIPGTMGRRFPHGLHELDGLTLFVTRGVGGIELPVRAFARPDVALLELRGA